MMPAQVIAGVEYIDNTFDDYMPAYNRYSNQNARCLGGFFQNEWKNERFSLLLGGRVDKHNLMDRVVFVPRANARYTPFRGIGFRTGYSSGYRALQVISTARHCRE